MDRATARSSRRASICTAGRERRSSLPGRTARRLCSPFKPSPRTFTSAGPHGSRFTLGSSGEPTEEFVQHVDDRVWYTSELMREHGWQHALLYRATSAVFKASTHFGMPGWPTVVAAAMERLTALDRSSAPEALGDLAEVEAALLEAPDRLGAHALDWLSGQIPFG